MKLLTDILRGVPEFQGLLAAVDNGGCPAAVTGLSGVHRAHFAAALHEETGRSVALVCADEGEAEQLARDLAAFTGEEVRTLFARELTFQCRCGIPPVGAPPPVGAAGAGVRGVSPPGDHGGSPPSADGA